MLRIWKHRKIFHLDLFDFDVLWYELMPGIKQEWQGRFIIDSCDFSFIDLLIGNRPISLKLPSLKLTSKVIESIVNKKVLNYFEDNQLLPKSQHGFRPQRSTMTAVSTMHEEWIKNKEKKCHQAVAFLDLSAAFDTLSKDIVCQKLSAYR